MDLRTKFYTGVPEPQRWASVYEYTPVDPAIFKTKGQIYSVISLSAPEGFNAITAGNLLIDHLHESYFEAKKSSVLACVDTAVNSVMERLTELMAHENSTTQEGVDLDMGIVVVRGDEIYFAVLGDSKILLLPNAKAKKVLDISLALKDPYGKDQLRVGSSYVLADQRFLVITGLAYQDLQQSDSKELLTDFSLNKLATFPFTNISEASAIIIGVDVEEQGELELAQEAEQEEAVVTAELDSDGNFISQDQVPLFASDEWGAQSAKEELRAESNVAESEQALDDFDQTEPFQGEFDTRQSAQEEPTDNTEEQLARLEATYAANEGAGVKVPFWKNIMQKFAPNSKQKDQVAVSEYEELDEEEAVNEELYPSRQPAHLAESATRRRQITSDTSTVKGMLINLGARISRFKDFVLYDVFKINNRVLFRTFTDDMGRKRFLILGIEVGTTPLYILGVILLLVFGYLSIKSIGQQRERENKLIEARNQLVLIRSDIDDLAASPVLNTQSIGDIPQREKFLTELAAVENKFSSNLDVLPSEDVLKEKDRIAKLETTVQKIKEPTNVKLALDVANKYEGAVADITVLNSNLYVLDKISGSIYRQAITGGEPELLVGGLTSPVSLSSDSAGNLVVLDLADKPIAIVNPASKAVTRSAVLLAKLPNASQIEVYTQTNSAYVISGLTKVLQMTRSGTSYGNPAAKARYTEAENRTIQDLQIFDGRIYLLVQGAGMVRVEVPQSRVEAFTDTLAAINTANAMSVDRDYILFADNVNKRLLAFTRMRDTQPISDLMAQVNLDKINEPIIEISTDADRNIIFLATATKVYSVSRDIIAK